VDSQQWRCNGVAIEEPGDNYGFVYVITNLTNQKKYIGKKFFWSLKRKQVNKKKKRITVESDWKKYWGSNDELKKDISLLGKEKFTREILHLCKSKGVTNYLEAREQFERHVLENKEEWYNSWIMVKVNRTHLNKL
tara:strand:+ start:8294 stop:8701 length:408 start_codon:yes stop_codon:yes gene_type:complete